MSYDIKLPPGFMKFEMKRGSGGHWFLPCGYYKENNKKNKYYPKREELSGPKCVKALTFSIISRKEGCK